MEPIENKRSITPEKAQQLLQEMGITISVSKAAMVLDYMRKIATLEIEKFNAK